MAPTPPSQPQEAAERTARHLRQCAELADLAMQLARAAAARTLADWAEPEQPPAAEPQRTPPAEPPEPREPAPHANPAPALHRPAPEAPRAAAPPKHTDPAILFTRLAAVARDCISLEARLAAGLAATPNPRALTPRADPRRGVLRDAIRLSTANHPDRAELNREFDTRLEEHLAADPDQTIDPLHVLETLCDELGIEIDCATLPDSCLFAFSGMNGLGNDAPDPHATSPP